LPRFASVRYVADLYYPITKINTVNFDAVAGVFAVA
jgi:hypothetical protein